MGGDAPLTSRDAITDCDHASTLAAGVLTLDVPTRTLRGPTGATTLTPLLAHVLATFMREPGRMFGRADLVELVRTGPDPRLAAAQDVAERITTALADAVASVGAPEWLMQEPGYSVELRRRSKQTACDADRNKSERRRSA